MRFSSGQADPSSFSFAEALTAFPFQNRSNTIIRGEADLRPIIYAPELSLLETLALAISALCPEDFDPHDAVRIAEAAFSELGAMQMVDEDLVCVDLAAGASRHGCGFEARLLGAYLAGLQKKPEILLLPDASGPEAASYAAYLSELLPVVALVPGSGLELPPHAAELIGKPGTHLIAPEGCGQGSDARDRFIAEARSMDLKVLVAGKGSPCRLLSDLLLVVGCFFMARPGLSGDLLMALPPGDREALGAGLWAWRWGLPLTAFVQPSSGHDSAALRSTPSEGPLGFPLNPRALLIEHEPSGQDLKAAAERWGKAKGLPLDQDSLAMAAAAYATLEKARFQGHGRVILPRIADPVWNDRTSRIGFLPERTLRPTPEEISGVLASILA